MLPYSLSSFRTLIDPLNCLPAYKSEEMFNYVQRKLEYHFYKTVLSPITKYHDGIRLLVPDVGNVSFYPRFCYIIADSPESCRVVGCICSPKTNSPCRVCLLKRDDLLSTRKYQLKDPTVSRVLMQSCEQLKLNSWDGLRREICQSDCSAQCSALSLNYIEVLF